MLVTIQLPRHFVIANFGEIKKADFEPWFQWRELAVYSVEMPGDFSAIVEILVSEQPKAMTTNLIGFSDDILCFLGEMFAKNLSDRWQIVFGEEEPPVRGALRVFQSIRGRQKTRSVERPIEPLVDLLPHTGLDLVRTHPSES
jgi:hypothetical protein